MNRTAAAHSKHDELLIVRLFGGDVDDRERALALGLLGECDDCATLFADLGTTAEATAALPVPARPRDFSLTEADAARLTRGRRGLGFALLIRRTRALGGSLMAIGLVGLVGTASLGALSSTATTLSADTHNYAAPEVAAASAASVATAASAAMGAADSTSGSAVPYAVPVPSGGTDLSVTKATSPAPMPSSPLADAAGSVAPTGQAPSGAQFDPVAGGSSDGLRATAPESSTGLDVRLIWFGGFGLLFLVGLGVLISPLIRRRRTR
jgi:hypothetical protein